MSEWRARVATSEWRYVRHTHGQCGDAVFSLEAKVFSGAWEVFGSIMLSCAGEDLGGEAVARQIVEAHNLSLTPPPTGGE